ncbi:MAG: S1C family serine protease [Microthrixaceae bacterium]
MDRTGDTGDDFPEDPFDWLEAEPPGDAQPRQWTHPSEAGLQARMQVDRRRGRRLALSLLAIGAGVLVGTAMVATVLRNDEPAIEAASSDEPLGDCLALIDAIVDGAAVQATGLLVDEDRHVLISGVDLRDATRISVRIDGASTGAELIAMDPYAGLSLLELDAIAGARPRIGSEPNSGEALRIVHYDNTGARRIRQAVVSDVGITWTRPDDTVAADVLTLTGDTTDTGVLVDSDGSVAGIIIGKSDGRAVAIGRAQLQEVVRRLAVGGIVERAWLGVRAADTTDPQAPGAKVVEALADSPAATAGIQAGDLIVSMGATVVRNLDDLVHATAALAPGDVVPVGVIRAGADLTIEVKLVEFPR